MTKAHSKTLLRPFILVVFIAKVKVEILHKKSNTKSYNKQLLTNFGCHKDLSTLKSDIHLGLRPRRISLFSGR